MCGYNGAKLQKKYEIANVPPVFLTIYNKCVCRCTLFVLVPHPREAFEIHRKIIEMSLKCHRDAVELFYNRCTIVDRLLLDNHSITTRQSLEKSRKRVDTSLFSLENAPEQPKMHFFCVFFGETLASFKKSSYFCIAIGSWCNGNTTGFGSVILGSNPGDPTKCADWLRYRR